MRRLTGMKWWCIGADGLCKAGWVNLNSEGVWV